VSFVFNFFCVIFHIYASHQVHTRLASYGSPLRLLTLTPAPSELYAIESGEREPR
jgi:hypothetical protein